MQHIWAPWRAEYFTQEKPKGCFFCTNSAQKDAEGKTVTDAETYILIRERTCFAMLNAFPYAGGHLMVSPYRHTGELNDLTEDELKDLMALSRRCKNLLIRAISAEGFNIGLNLGKIAGAGMPDHLHMHIVPRWTGDSNFMTVLADARVVNEGLRQTYEKLLKHIDEPALI